MLVHPESLAARNGPARDVADALDGVLTWCVWLHQAEFDERPAPTPHWWDEFSQSTEWRARCRDNKKLLHSRHQYALYRTRDVISRCYDQWERLWKGFRTPGLEPSRPDEVKASLGVMRQVLSPAQEIGHWKTGCVPHRRHLVEPVRKSWTPLPISDAEKSAEATISRVGADIVLGKRPAPQARRELQAAKDEHVRLRDARFAADSVAQQGRVTEAERTKLIKLRDEWSAVVERWDQAEEAIRGLVQYLRGRTPMADSIKPTNHPIVIAVLLAAAEKLEKFADGVEVRFRREGETYVEHRPPPGRFSIGYSDDSDAVVNLLWDTIMDLHEALRGLEFRSKGELLAPSPMGQWVSLMRHEWSVPEGSEEMAADVLAIGRRLDILIPECRRRRPDGPHVGKQTVLVETVNWARRAATHLRELGAPPEDRKGRTAHPASTSRLKAPSEREWAAYRLVKLMGVSQEKAVETLASRGVIINQGQISRGNRKCDAWIAAGNIMPDELKVHITRARGKLPAVDPGVVGMGEREDGHTRAQRERPEE